jgi:cbb3-type cytochrome oxidase subunit 1
MFFVAGMFLMAYNVWQTVRAGSKVAAAENPDPAVAAA